MTFLATGNVNYRARIERAALLAERHPFAHQVLSFYGSIAKFQKEFYEALPKRWGKNPVVLEPFAEFLQVIEQHAPDALVQEARNLKSKGAARQGEILHEFWKTGLLETHLAVAG